MAGFTTQDACPTCGKRDNNREQDGSTFRHINRELVHRVWRFFEDAYEEGDELGALEAYQDLKWDSERMLFNRWLNTKQRAFLRRAEYASSDSQD